MQSLKNGLQLLKKYPSALVGLLLILMLFGISIYTIFAIPYNTAIELWRGGDTVWGQNPKVVPPVWVNWWRTDKLPETIIRTMEDEDALIERKTSTAGENLIITYTFDFQADEVPQDMIINFAAKYTNKSPFVSVFWTTPDGREIRVTEQGITFTTSSRAIQDEKLKRRLGGISPDLALFDNPETEEIDVLKGTYKIVIDAITFEEDSVITKAEVLLHGKVFGWFGTDTQRRDLTVAILWGTAIALGFGLTASFGTAVFSMIFAAIGVWYGGWVDELIQRITEISINLPFLSLLIMIGTFYSRSIWTILPVALVG